LNTDNIIVYFRVVTRTDVAAVISFSFQREPTKQLLNIERNKNSWK